MPIRAVMLDIGGVLERNPPTGWRQRWEARLGLEEGGLDRRVGKVWTVGAVGRISEPEALVRVAALLKLGADEAQALMREAWDEYLGALNQDLAGYVSGLRPRYRVALVSNSFVGARERERSRHGLERLCDLIVYSHEEGVAKPDPRIYRIACERLGVSPGEVVFCDDTEGHVLAAEALGMRGVVFRETPQAISEIDAVLAARSA